VSLAFNLGMLGYFKYGNFFAQNLHRWLGHTNPPMWDIILPIGISFYTFESLAYTINVYRGERASRSLLDFALPFVLPAPGRRSDRDRAPSSRSSRRWRSPARRSRGARPHRAGLEEGAARGRHRAVRRPRVEGHGALRETSRCVLRLRLPDRFRLHDIALACRALGLVPENFDRSTRRRAREFWQRWHISLSTWLRDYLYVSLGGNRRGTVRTYVNLLLTMLLGGLWHGAAWTFVIWGAYHGTLLVVHRLIARDREPAARGAAGTWLARAGMFHLVVLGWVFFRAPAFGDAIAAFGRLGTLGYAPIRVASEAAIVLGVGILLHCGPPARRVREWFIGLSPVVQGTAYAAATIVAFFIAPASERFIYFQF
jgi:hypothetical protein